MYRLVSISVLILLFLTGCADVTNNAGKKDGPSLYKQACSACHGEKLQGASGPALNTETVKNMSEEEMVTIIVEGKGVMPGKTLSEADAQIVAKWLEDQNQ